MVEAGYLSSELPHRLFTPHVLDLMKGTLGVIPTLSPKLDKAAGDSAYDLHRMGRQQWGRHPHCSCLSKSGGEELFQL